MCKIAIGETDFKNIVDTESKIKKQNSYQLRVSDGYERLFISQEFSDTTVLADGKKFNLHKCILVNHSPVIRAMFTHDFQEKKYKYS